MHRLNMLVILLYVLSAAFYAAYLFVQKKAPRQGGYYFLLAGFLVHSVSITAASISEGMLPARNLAENLSIASWAVAGVFLLLRYKFDLKILGIYAAPLAALTMITASQLPNHPPETASLFKSFWLTVHVITIFIGEAAFALACGVSIFYLIQEYAIKNKKHGFFFKRLPSLDLLDSTGYACIVVGFILLTLGLISGFVYAKSVWGRFWSWDTKEVWSIISWLVYVALLHQRLTVGWRGRKAAIMAIIGFCALLFTFFGVNFFLQGHHDPFTRL
ncbi:MAG: c-type cytochrome biogenesis protein CcsB [Thermodesulfobacteriota bacterium]